MSLVELDELAELRRSPPSPRAEPPPWGSRRRPRVGAIVVAMVLGALWHQAAEGPLLPGRPSPLEVAPVVTGPPSRYPPSPSPPPVMAPPTVPASTRALLDTPPPVRGPEYGRPMLVRPDQGLADHTHVDVVGWGFPAVWWVGLVMCDAEMVDHHGQGVAWCDSRVLHVAELNPDGSFAARTQLRRHNVFGDGQVVDCAAAPLPGRTTRCVLVAGTGWGSGEVAIADVWFSQGR